MTKIPAVRFSNKSNEGRGLDKNIWESCKKVDASYFKVTSESRRGGFLRGILKKRKENVIQRKVSE